MNDKFKKGEKLSVVTLVINVLLALGKAVVGVLSGSSALVADAVHSGSDSVTTVGVILGLRVAQQPPDKEHPYGHGRAESISAKVLAILLFVVGLEMVRTSVKDTLAQNFTVPGKIALWMAILSIVVKELMYQVTVKEGKKINSRALISDAWHHRSDALSSVASSIGIFAARHGYPFLDPLVAGVVAIIVMKTAWDIFRSTFDEFMDAQVDNLLYDAINNEVVGVSGVVHVDEIRSRRYGANAYIDLRISVDHELTVEQGHNIASAVRNRIVTTIPEVTDVLVHVDPFDAEKEQA
ncbi:MAG: cation diffusion facilitator family transporter [Limnochordia bacterium]|nr:cation diffusion facilitator family transporter [Limnochordia bacterium]